MTNPIAPFEKDVVKEAIMWVIRLQSAGETLATIQACEHWRMAHQSHEQAWQHIQGLVTQMRQGSAALSNHQASKILENAAQHMQRRRALKMLSLSFTVGVSTWLASDLAAWQNLAADYATAVGDQKKITLADGSQLMLNTDSAVDIRFDRTQRLIVLARGEVLITSGHDVQALQRRPLRVQTGHGLFEALGTRFVVRQNKNATQLSVEEGAVSIQSVNRTQATEIVAHAGECYTVTSTEVSLDHTSDMQASAWADGVIATKNMRLVDFLAEVSRYRPGHIRCDDSIANLRLSGVFQLKDTDQLLAILPQTLPVRLEYRTRWWVMVAAKE